MHRRQSMGRALVLFLLLGVCLPAAQADERETAKPEPRPEERAGREVLSLLAADDKKGLAKFAQGTSPDPWMTVDWLLSQGRADAAEALAEVAKQHAATRRLPKYVAATRTAPGEGAARAALARAVLSIEAGRYAEAYPHLEKLDAQDANVLAVQIHFARGIGLYVLKRRDEAVRELAAGRERAARIGWLTLESQILMWLAQTELERGNLVMAVAHARARVRVEDGLTGRHEKHGHALMRLSKALRKSGEYDAALEAAKRALAVQREAKDDLGAARMLVLMGTVAAAAEDYAKGVEYTREGLDVFEEAGDAPGIADALIAVGSVYDLMDEYQQARTFLKRAVRHAKATGQHGYEARALAHLGTTYTSTGDYPDALKCFEASLAYDRKRKDTARIAFNLNNLAVLYEELGDRARSRKLLRETLTLFEGMNDQASIASVCLNLGVLARIAQDWDESSALLNRAARIRRRSNKPRDVASVLSALGALASDRGNYAEAVGLHKEAIRLYGASHDRGKIAMTTTNLGLALHRMGDSEEALKLIDRGLVEATSIRNPKLEVMVRETLALVHLEVGNPERAVMVAEQGLLAMEHLLGGLAEEESVRARTSHTALFQVGALAALQMKAPAKVLRFLEAGRAGSLLESLGGRDALRYTDLPEALRKAEKEARLAEAVAARRFRRASRGSNLDQRRNAAKGLAQATERVRDVIAKIQREAKAQADLAYPRPASLSEIQRWLAANQALVIYGFCKQQVLAVILDRKSIRALSLGAQADVTKACQAFSDAERPAADGSALTKLSALLVEPLALDDSVKKVLVSPSGALCYTPFGALFDQAVTMTPSGTTHALLRTLRHKPGQGVLALGDPAYPNATSEAGKIYTRSGHLTRLPGTRKEAQNVGDVVLLGEDASERGFREGLGRQRRWRAVHLACHGRVDLERPTLCALALTPGDEDDGFLTALEVLRMKIPADLAVLSACETGSGRVFYGEGIVGLTRAFMYAGAPRVLCSLWKVDDEATQALMTKFYALWNPPNGKGISADEALKRAQAHVRSQKKWSAPHYWAAWVLWGLPD